MIRTTDGRILQGPGLFALGASPLPVFHGTPHKVDRFTTRKIGTGEGAQVYGWGLYFTENKQVAEKYQKMMEGALLSSGYYDRNIAALEDHLQRVPSDDIARRMLEGYKEDKARDEKRSGNLYKVSLKVDDQDLLDWDRPLNEQSPRVKKALQRFMDGSETMVIAGRSISLPRGSDIYEMLRTGLFSDTYKVVDIFEADHLVGITNDFERASRHLNHLGIRGIRYLDGNSRSNGKGSYNYVIFDENDIEILEENGKPVSFADALNTSELPTPDYAPFYSQLSRVIEAKMPKSATPAQVLQIATSGAKVEEIKWSGLVQVIQSLAVDGKVPKDSLLKYLADEGMVRFEEVVLSDSLGAEDPALVAREEELLAEADAAQDKYMAEYRSALEQGKMRDAKTREVLDRLEADYNKKRNLWYKARDAAFDSSKPKRPTLFSEYTLPGGENYREVVLAMPGDIDPIPGLTKEETQQFLSIHAMPDPDMVSETIYHELKAKITGPKPNQRAYTSSHFPNIPNYVAHMRANERMDAQGKQGLFIEEIQSDRHQAGRKEGYASDAAEWFTLRNSSGQENGRFKTREGAEKEAATRPGWSVAPVGDPNLIADAPFRTTWPLAMFKRALRDAVASGKDWIGWTVGETQVERFDLSKQIESIEWNEDTEQFKGVPRNENSDDIVRRVAREELPKVVGEEVAERLLASRPWNGTYELTGENLKVGGSGMKGFYDVMLPKEIGKYVKAWGGKVEKVELKQEVEADIMNGEEGGIGSVPIWRIDITPAMKASVEAGQALFTSELPTPDAAYLAAVEAGDMETAQRMVDDAAKKAGKVKVIASFPKGVTPRPRRSGDWVSLDNQEGRDYQEEYAGPDWKARYISGFVDNGAWEDMQTGWARGQTLVLGQDAVSADPVTYDSNGNIIPLSKRFNPSSDSILETSPLPEADANIEELRIRGSERLNKKAVDEYRLQQEQFGVVVGAPRLANPGNTERSRREQDVYDEAYQNHEAERRTDANVMREARRRFKEDPKGIEEKWLDAAYGNKTWDINDADVLAVGLLINQRSKEAGNDLAKHEANGVLRMAYRLVRREQARALRMGFDKFLTPKERHREWLVEAVYSPTTRIEKEAENPNWSPQKRRDFIRQQLAARLKLIEDQLKSQGLSLDEIFSGEGYMSLSKAKIMENLLKKRDARQQMIVQLIQKNYPLSKIRKKTGATNEEIQKVAQETYDEAMQEAIKRARQGATLEDFKDDLGLSAGNLAGDERTEAEILAEARRIVEVGFGLRREVSDAVRPKRSPKAKEKSDAESEATAAMQIAERWVDKLATSQSDTLSWPEKAKKNMDALTALIRQHIKEGVKDFQAKAVALGATENQARILDAEGNDERRRIAAIKDGRERARNSPEEVAKQILERLAKPKPDPKEKNKLRALVASHLRKKVRGFQRLAREMGLSAERAEELDREITRKREELKEERTGRVMPEELDPLTANWQRPILDKLLESYAFDTKDRTELMSRVAAIRRIASATGKISTLTGADKAKALEHLAKLNAILAKYGTDAEGIFNSKYPADDYVFDIGDRYQVAAVARAISAVDADIVDKAVEWTYSAILGGLQTMIVNATATLNAGWEGTIGRGFEMALNAAFKDKGMAAEFGEVKHIMRALKPAYARAISNAGATWGAELPMFDEDFLNRPADLDKMFDGKAPRIGSIGGRKGRVIRVPTRALLATDEFNRTLIAMAELGAIAYRFAVSKGLKPGTPEFDKFLRKEVNTPGSFCAKIAAQKASRLIFTNPLPGQTDPVTGQPVKVEDIGDVVGYAAYGINRMLTHQPDNLFAKALFALMRLSFLPFQRTPFNIMRAGARHTLNPISLIDILMLTVRNSRVRGASGKMEWKWNAQGRHPEIIERLGQQMQGTALLLLLLAAGAGEGDDDDLDKWFVMTGSSPWNPRRRGERETKERSGLGPFRVSFRRNDGSERFGFNYGRIEPFATTIGATIDTINRVKTSLRKDEGFAKGLGSAQLALAAQSKDKTFMQGFSDMVRLGEDLTDEERAGGATSRFVASRIAMVIPNIIKQPIRETDPVFRDRSDGFVEDLFYQMAPLGQKEAKLDPYGKPVTKTGNSVARIVDIFDSGTSKVNPYDGMLLRWQTSGKWKDAKDERNQKPWFPSPIASATYRDPKTGKTVEMNATQLAKFRELSGRRTLALLDRAALNTRNPSERDIDKMRDIVTDSRRYAKEMLSKTPAFWKMANP
jgi:hypothetical protein